MFKLFVCFLVLFAFAEVISGDGVLSGICPVQNHKGEKLYHLRHHNCNKFYKCDHGKRIMYVCDEGLHFNVMLGVCDYPHAAKCVELEPECPAAMGNYIYLPHPQQCPNYYECQVKECPVGHYFSQRCGTCMPADDAHCTL